MNNEINNIRIKKFLRTQVKWYTENKITEKNLIFKIADCRESYPDFNYELEFGLIYMELKVQLIGLHLVEATK